jgi:hypothetical protein
MRESGRGGNTSGRCGGGRRGGSSNKNNGDKLQQYNRLSDYNIDYKPNGQPLYEMFNGNGNFGANNGSGHGNGGGTCFIYGSTGHQANQCPKTGLKSLIPFFPSRSMSCITIVTIP